ncbi:ARM repeat-containing protein [Rhizoclosmatium globosum]|uniref:ARM repeat-containing protein n=1 Tax=Rhizoclosmatium globosum TaxID=329046 RepID=A0A1Y2B7F3_9FUNG|nr:ARM repeat-containing protein [Rhizoclosmatium globosum]|eukprot:ORY30470.1 ARM repeat-containing protein [Rhizoclosmatium globosum]
MEGTATQVRLSAMNNLLKELRISPTSATTVPSNADVIRSLRICLTDNGKEIRANGFRILRHIVISQGLSTVRLSMALGIDVFLVRALTRDHRYDIEREQAMKMVRAFLDIEGAVQDMSFSLIRLLVALAENPDDKLRVVALETICEIAILNTELLAKCGGIRVIFGALGETFAKPAVNQILVSTIMFLLDSESSRIYIRPDVELEAIISCLSDPLMSYDRIKTCIYVLSLIMKTWTGVFFLCMNKKRSMKAVMDCLKLPNDVSQTAILELIFGVLGMKVKGGSGSGKGGRDQNALTNYVVEYETLPDRDGNSLYHSQCIWLMVFLDSGLLETLSHTAHSDSKDIVMLSTILASEIQKLSRNLPDTYATRIQSMSSLFEMASDFSNEFDRHCATAAFSHIDAFYETANSIRFADVKEVVSGTIDNNSFRSTVADADKVFMRESAKWPWDFVNDFLLILLNNSGRAEEVLRSTKALKRLLSFFKPFGSGFLANMKETDVNMLKTIGCNLMKVLLSCADGMKLLTESKFMLEISEEFNRAIDPANEPLPADALFSKNRMQNYASDIYFHLLAEFSNSLAGLSILHRYKIFNMFYVIAELQTREDLIKSLINSFDFTNDGHERVILSKLMTSSEKTFRLYATDVAGKLLISTHDSDTRLWCVGTLVTQTYDSSKEIRDKAKISLESACEIPGVVEAILSQNPAYHLDALTNLIYMRFLRFPAGFSYLQSHEYIVGELNFWVQYGMFNYVTRVELLLEEKYKKQPAVSGTPLAFPIHFYGELAKTPAGRDLLEESGHFDMFVNVIRENNYSNYDMLMCLKACLWAVGHIGSSSIGMEFLRKSNIVADIVKLSSTAGILSLRGTCVYVLSFLGHCPAGMEELEKNGWNVLPGRKQTAIAFPVDIESLINVEPWEFKGAWTSEKVNMAKFNQRHPVEQEILKNVGTLSNHVLAKGSLKAIGRAQMEYPEFFRRVSLYISIMSLMSQRHYRLTARRFLQEMFDQVEFDEEQFDQALIDNVL